MEQEIQQETEALLLAQDVLRSTRASLLLHLRFLENALFRLQPEPARTTFATNGAQLYYGFSFLFSAYRRSPAHLMRGYLHTLMHCIFRHPFVSGAVNRKMWDLAADVAVEAVIEDLHLRAFDEERAQRLRPYLRKLRDAGVHLTAEKLYRYFLAHPDQQAEFAEMMSVFTFCDHSCWYTPLTDQTGAEDADGSEDGTEDSGPVPESSGCNGSKPQDASAGADAFCTAANAHGSQLDEKWAETSRHIQIDLETFAREAGETAGSFLQDLRALNRERYDYRSFLLRFAQPREVMKVSEDEFDYIFYTYGLQLYGNVPLIEPLEYREDRRIREFAIVIDTSGSTSGDLVQAFLQKTYNILKTTETFDSRMRLRVIQADAAVQESRLLQSLEEIEVYMRQFRIRGGGGTDFRPAFAHVDDLIHTGEMRHLRGLIYFTDGYGTFPEKQPPYDSAFVFVRDTGLDSEPPPVPPWAIKLVLDMDEIAVI